MADVDISWLLLVMICILLILCSLLYLSKTNNQSSLNQYASDVRNSLNQFVSYGKKKRVMNQKDEMIDRKEDKALFNDILNEKQLQEEESLSPSSEEEKTNSDDSEEETRSSVIDYETYTKVCEDYRKTTLALKERESEVASLMKELETKSLTIKMLNDKLLSYGSSLEKDEAIPNCHEIIEQQKQIIESLLATDGSNSNIDKLLNMYEAKVHELAEAKQTIEKMKIDYEQLQSYQKKSELVDKLMIENEALRARIRMEIQIPSYPITPMAGYPYPLLPPGFGYSQNTSVTDGNSIGIIMGEDQTHQVSNSIPPSKQESITELPPSLEMGPDVLSTSSQSSLQKIRSLKLKNKVYFQIVEATNSIQKEASKKGGTVTKLSSASITKIARFVLECENDIELKKKIIEIIPCIQFCSEKEYSVYIQQIRSALNKQ